MQKDPLVGLRFHTVDADNRTQHQGIILSAAPDSYYLIQLFEWWGGIPTHCKLVHISDFAARTGSDKTLNVYKFFETAEDADDYYQRYGAPRDNQIDERRNNEQARTTTRTDYIRDRPRP